MIATQIVAEAERLLDRSEAEHMPLRLLGGVAVRLRASVLLPAAFERSYGDLDFVGAARSTAAITRFFESDGYESDRGFNALQGRQRLIFLDIEHRRKVDVFVGEFEMCHAVPMEERLELEPRTVPLAELVLTKLQVVELNEKDVRDALALVHGHEVAERDGDAINAARIAELCACDWGLWRTITANIRRCRELAGRYELSAEELATMTGRLDALLDRIDAEPKSRRWRLRARVGERVRWYELPEEI